MCEKIKLGILCIGTIEICIGVVTFIAVVASVIMGSSVKPPAVLSFVLGSAGVSLWLGVGIIRRAIIPYRTLLFFCAVIILSKILIFTKIIYLAGALETIIPSPIKNAVSLAYHGLLIFYFTRPEIKKLFQCEK